MKYIRILFLVAVMLFCAQASYAEHDGYIVTFKTVPYGLDTEIFEEIHAKSGIFAVDSLDAVACYEEYIESIEENEIITVDFPEVSQIMLMALPDDDMYSSQWHTQMINADYFWQHETYGNDIKVAVIDSGCYAHADLMDNLLTGKNIITGSSDTSDTCGHGTHVCGIIASAINSSGMVGVAPKAKLVPIKSFEGQKTTISQITKGIYSAIDDFDCDIINMSWGLTQNNSKVKDAIDYASDNGAILIASVGNNTGTAIHYPAAYDNVIGVGSVNSDKSHSSFSNHNSSVYITAPGDTINSTYMNGGYEKMYGTSQSAPHISGLAALALSCNPDLTHGQFARLLAETAEDLGDTGYDEYFGYGLADGEALMDKMLEDVPYYTSPVNESDDGHYVLIKNNTDETLSAKSIFASYTLSKFNTSTVTDVTLMPEKSAITKTTAGGEVSHFLWSSLEYTKPLGNKR